MPRRTTEDKIKVEDLLREEYFDILPDIRRVVWQLEAEIRCHTLPILQSLESHEQLVVKSRLKDCESALKSLRRRQEGGTYDPDRAGGYTLTDLPDLAGVRILVFPRGRLHEVDSVLRTLFPDWAFDPVPDDAGGVLAPKYNGFCAEISHRVRAEYQIVPMLIGLFWEVEHSALYKPAPAFKGKADSEPLRKLNSDVVRVLTRFESEFEGFIRD